MVRDDRSLVMPAPVQHQRCDENLPIWDTRARRGAGARDFVILLTGPVDDRRRRHVADTGENGLMSDESGATGWRCTVATAVDEPVIGHILDDARSRIAELGLVMWRQPFPPE